MRFVAGPPLLWAHPFTQGGKDYPLQLSEYQCANGLFSPDGHWLAYTSEESEPNEVYVVPYPSLSARWQISTGGGNQPRWRGDGKEIYYIAPDGVLMAVPIEVSDGSLRPGVPKTLFHTNIVAIFRMTPRYDVAKDGQKFLINSIPNQSGPETITIYANWQAALGER
jgi:hypothetical protein